MEDTHNARDQIYTEKKTELSDNSREFFKLMIQDLDGGALWSFMLKREEFSKFKAEEDLKSHFRGLCRSYLPGLSESQKQDFVRKRFAAGYTPAGIIDTFPALGYKKEWDLKF